MKKSEPKLILNLQVDSEELDQKVKLAMDKYIEDVIVGNLDDEIEKIVTKRIGALVTRDISEMERLLNNIKELAYRMRNTLKRTESIESPDVLASKFVATYDIFEKILTMNK